jgi:hypothetical protein
MERSCTRRAAMGLATTLMACWAAGCQNDKVPIVEFPKGAPPPPPQAEKKPGPPQGSATSQGEPPH